MSISECTTGQSANSRRPHSEQLLNATAYTSSFMTTENPCSNDCFQQDNNFSWTYSHRITIENSTFGMWWNRRFMSWKEMQQICSNCVILSCKYELKSLRNLSHEELKRLWRGKPSNPVLANEQWVEVSYYTSTNKCIMNVSLQPVQI